MLAESSIRTATHGNPVRSTTRVSSDSTSSTATSTLNRSSVSPTRIPVDAFWASFR